MNGEVTTATLVVCRQCGRVLGVEDWWQNNHHRDHCPKRGEGHGSVEWILVVVPLS